MANELYIDYSGFEKIINQLKTMPKEIAARVDDVLSAGAQDIATEAKRRAPVDMGGLHAAIASDSHLPLVKHITVNAFYSSYVEFGTGSYAAAYVGSLPADWQAFAAQFKGQAGKGTAYDLWQALIGWVSRHSQFKEGAVTGRHSKKTGRRLGKKDVKQAENEAAAYLIMRKILKKGVKPQPFLYPAYEQNRSKILRAAEEALKSI